MKHPAKHKKGLMARVQEQVRSMKTPAQTSLIKVRRGGEVEKFNPRQTTVRLAALKEIEKRAEKLQRWDKVEDAINQKVDEQERFVAWWTANVTVRHGGDRKSLRRIKNSDQSTCSIADAEKLTGVRQQQVSRWRRMLKTPGEYRAFLIGLMVAKIMAQKDTTAKKFTGDPESYTPREYIEAARKVLGDIDLDPASNSLAQKTVKAAEFFDEKADGLKQSWKGRVFLNPPYSHPEIAHFIEKLCVEFESGSVTAAILLTNDNTDTAWWHRGTGTAAAVCFLKRRINFYKADGSTTSPTNGQNFFYFGDKLDRFKEIFGEFGLIMVKL